MSLLQRLSFPVARTTLSALALVMPACAAGSRDMDMLGNEPAKASGAHISDVPATHATGASKPAPTRGGGHSAPYPFEPLATSSAISKVKNLLTGLPATDIEVAAVEAGLKSQGAAGGVSAMKALVQNWVGAQTQGALSVATLTPYQAKMMAFFANAFQQSQTTVYDLTLLNGYLYAYSQANNLLLADLQQMFALTVLEKVAANGGNGSFADVIDTREFMMTPAIASYYAFLDNQILDDGGNFTDRTLTANPNWSFTISGAGPIPIASAVQSMTFYSSNVAVGSGLPSDCTASEPWSMSNATSGGYQATAELQYLLSGWQVGAALIPDGTGCLPNPVDYGTYASTFYLQPSDFTTWSMVKIRQPTPGEGTQTFYDLGALRALPNQELVLTTPRVGYYTTQAFLAGWNTNASNEARVTMNQTMIVGLGRAFDLTNHADTSVISSAATDMTHAANPACFTCHQTLDPMRQFFRQAYSVYFSEQTAPAEQAMPGQFAFDGVSIGGPLSIYDLGAFIKNHPAFAGAWVQKLCTYATSQACDTNDPEFQRIVSVFQQTNYSWTALVTELFSSPILTYLSESVSSDEQGETFPLTRGNHLCSLLSNRLGITDICGLLPTTVVSGPLAEVQGITSAMPSDQYSRGSTAPVLANAPSVFYRAALENVCVSIANVVVDAPGSSAYLSATPQTAIDNMVHQLMGLTSDRVGTATEGPAFILQSHFQKALGQAVDAGGPDAGGVATAADALRSTFVLACESPYVAGVGQ